MDDKDTARQPKNGAIDSKQVKALAKQARLKAALRSNLRRRKDADVPKTSAQSET